MPASTCIAVGAVLVGVREFHVQSLDESLAERRQFVGRRCARVLGAAVIRREEQNEAPLRYQLAACLRRACP
jgi:hypothetical protein